jgi:hypothetical protein
VVPLIPACPVAAIMAVAIAAMSVQVFVRDVIMLISFASVVRESMPATSRTLRESIGAARISATGVREALGAAMSGHKKVPRPSCRPCHPPLVSRSPVRAVESLSISCDRRRTTRRPLVLVQPVCSCGLCYEGVGYR